MRIGNRFPEIAGLGIGATALALLGWLLAGTGLCSP
jgi:hypothetical protein